MDYMKLAIKQAKKGIKKNHGGPFGCVIVKDKKVIAKGHNEVLKNHDATCHGEIVAIRKASKKLKTHDLSGCELYTTGEPCPMCLAACLWANIDKVYYGCTIKDNGLIGFRDKVLDEKMSDRKKLEDYLSEIKHEECLELFREYNSLDAEKY